MGHGRRIAQEPQVGATGIVGRLRGELDDRHGRVAGHEVRGCLVDAVRDLLQGRAEPIAVGLVAQDRRREVEDEHDLRAVGRRLRAHGGHATTADEEEADEEHGDGSDEGPGMTHGGLCTTGIRSRRWSRTDDASRARGLQGQTNVLVRGRTAWRSMPVRACEWMSA